MSVIAPGIVHEKRATVSEEYTAKHLGSGSVQVLATPAMIALMERTSHEAVEPLLAQGQTTVGVLVTVRHLAATPLGMEVRIRSELMAVDGRKLTFKVEAFDAAEKIGDGMHERYIIDLGRFEERLQRKREGKL
jgi:fluoroacetyl-CoA thioesterase